jgi:hypothetical protein
MGRDDERYPRNKNDKLDISFVHLGISHVSLSNDWIFLIDLGYPIPNFLMLEYLRARDVLENKKISLRYPAHSQISGISMRSSISLRYPRTSPLTSSNDPMGTVSRWIQRFLKS